MNKWALGIIAVVLLIAAVVYGIYQKNDYDFNDATKSYEVVNTWELPEELNEISGLHWMGDGRIACIQDEDGIIFIYDLNSAKIIQKHKFALAGDYEAITYLNENYWVAKSSGELFRIESIKPKEKIEAGIRLELKYNNNIEGIAAAPDGKIWISFKDRNLKKEGDYRGLYAFDPKTNKLDPEPVAKVNYKDQKFDLLKTGNPRKLLRPSDIGFHPLTGELYILDAEFQKLIITNTSGKIKKLHLLDPEEFSQPEGITFSESGRIFISNENLGGPANIKEVKFH
ncbi:SdiA-regulated domain-containing protein [Christiangramia aquimixticola]|uniref:SdiA-regulated domain-containing protein n=1 Tax=Christiangramia aquimixticola TaxID=1697558 RepID=UPI003AA997B8